LAKVINLNSSSKLSDGKGVTFGLLIGCYLRLFVINMLLLQRLLDRCQPLVRQFAIRVAAVLFLISSFFGTASAWHGIPSDGKDFYIGYMPGIRHTTSAWSNVFETYYVLVGSYSDGNIVTISYFDQTTGKEYADPTFVVNKERSYQQVLDMNHMGPCRPAISRVAG
jgi:hypothetical protein